MSKRRYFFTEDGLQRAIAEAWANQTPETRWMDVAGQPIPKVVATAILGARRWGSRSTEWWTPERRREAAEAGRRAHVRQPVAQPIYLVCGCLEGTHENSSIGIHEAHPDVLGWDLPGSFYGGIRQR